MNLRKTTAPPPTWAGLSRDEQDLLARLCLVSLDGILIVGLDTATLRVADALLVARVRELEEDLKAVDVG